MKALGIGVETNQQQGELQMFPGCAVTELSVQGRPESIPLRIRSEVWEGITSLVIFGGRPYEYSGSVNFTLTVPVQWQKIRGRWTPQTRKRGVDNADVIILDQALQFKDIQVALITRGERFFITAQQIYQGWIRVVENNIRFIPSKPPHAYPGMDYAQAWQGMGEVLASMGRIVHEVVAGLGVALDMPDPAQWASPEIPVLPGWQRGTVEFFNPITNTGRLINGHGVEYHIGSNVLNEVPGPVKLLAPMSDVYFRPGQPQKDQRYISVKAIKTA